MAIMALGAVIYLLLMAYVDAIKPGPFGRARPWHFIFPVSNFLVLFITYYVTYIFCIFFLCDGFCTMLCRKGKRTICRNKREIVDYGTKINNN